MLENKNRKAFRRILWLVIGGIGYALSPLSWWNDLYVNLPISYLAANVANNIHHGWFLPVMTGTYWLTNIAGILLLRMGAEGTVTGSFRCVSGKAMLKWFLFCLLYTAVMVICRMTGLLLPFNQYIPDKAVP